LEFSGIGLASGLNQVGLTPALHVGKKGTVQKSCRMRYAYPTYGAALQTSDLLSDGASLIRPVYPAKYICYSAFTLNVDFCLKVFTEPFVNLFYGDTGMRGFDL
jgi:hypothetical protein